MKITKNKKPNSTPPPPLVIKKTNLELSQLAIDALARLKTNNGVNRTFAIERGVIMLEKSLAGGAK